MGSPPMEPPSLPFLMAATGGNASPYVEEQTSAEADGKIHLERRPVNWPQPANYERGSWISVIAVTVCRASAVPREIPGGSRTAASEGTPSA